MAKTIKFNLILDNTPVRTIEDLRENFSIEDILEVYKNGLLQRWLEVRGYAEYLDKVKDIKVENSFEQIQELIRIFEVQCDADKIKEGVEILSYLKERKSLIEEYNKSNYKVKEIIKDYHAGYDAIVNDIIKNNEDMPKIKANIKEIEENYMSIFKLNYKELYDRLIENAPLSIFAILMNETMKSYFIAGDYSSENICLIYNDIKKFICTETIVDDKLGNEIKSFKGNTEAYWKDIEPKDKKLMIINMEPGNYVRNAGTFGEELSSEDINGKFMILEGIDYKSNNEYHELTYMEV